MTDTRQIVHGVTCPKKPHIGDGYSHSETYDGPYLIDGLTYCGRCHQWTEWPDD